MFLRNALAIVSLGAIFLLAHQADAGILFTTGAMTEITSPVSFLVGDTESSTEILILDEGVTILPSEIFVNAVGPGLHSGSSGTAVPILAGTSVHSYIVHFDPIGIIFATLSGEVIFDPGETILGIQTHTPYLFGSDLAVGDPDATYPTIPLEFRALDTLPGIDSVTIAGDLSSASFTLFAELKIDQARIFTIPEPASVTLAAVSLLGFLGCGRRRRQQAA